MAEAVRTQDRPVGTLEVDAAPEPGPIATAVGVAFTFFAPILVLGAYPIKPTVIVILALMPIAVLLLLSKQALLSLRVSMPLVGYVAWAVASLAWAESVDSTFLDIRVFVTSIVSMSLVASFLPRDLYIKTLLRSMQFIVVLTLVGVVATPSGRSVASLGGLDVSGGWRGFFGHKNLMSPVVVLASIMNFAFERDRRIAYVVTGSATALMLGAQSVTGLAAFVVALLVWQWTGLVSRGALRDRSIAKVITSLIAIVGFGLVLSFVGTLVDAFGKDLTFSGRTDIWELSWPIIGEQPIQGYGLAGPYGDLRNQVGLQFFQALGFYVQHAHNALIDLLASLGIVGVVLVSALLIGCVRSAWRLIDHSPMLARWVIASLVSMVFMGFSESLFAPSYLMLVAGMRLTLMGAAVETPRPTSLRRGAQRVTRSA